MCGTGMLQMDACFKDFIVTVIDYIVLGVSGRWFVTGSVRS